MSRLNASDAPVGRVFDDYMSSRPFAKRSVFYIACRQLNGSKVLLPEPFDVLSCVADGKRKGHRVLACLTNDWRLKVLLAPPGFAIINHNNYPTLTNMVFMQCTNTEHGSVGYISVGRSAVYPNGQRRKRLRNLTAGPIDHCFFCIIQGFFFSDGVLFCIYHKLKPPSPTRPSLLETMTQSRNNSQRFVASAFEPGKTISRAVDVEFVYLSQMTGPTLSVWKQKSSLFLHESLSYVEMRKNPDPWTNSYIDQTTNMLGVMNVAAPKWRGGHGLHGKVSHSAKKNEEYPFHHLGLQRLQSRLSKKCDIFICRSREKMLEYPKYNCGHVLEFYTSETSEHLLFVELTVPQIPYVNTISAEYQHMHPELYNAMLLYCLHKSGRRKIILLRQTVNDNTTDTTMTSLLNKNDDDPAGPGIVKLSSTVWKITLDNAKNGVFDCPHGLCIQLVYSWPFEKIVNKNLVKIIDHYSNGTGTTRYRTVNNGVYQSMGPHSTTLCPASMGAHPLSKSYHHQWRRNMNSSIAPLIAKFRNMLRDQTCAVAFSSGQVLSPALKKACGLAYVEIYEQCLFTFKNYCNTRHSDPDRFSIAESKEVITFLKQNKSERCSRFIAELQNHLVKGRLPQETTCAWTLVEKSETHNLRQFFANFTAGVALDLSSSAFGISEQLGSTFLGATFEHCSTRPIWIRRSDSYISLTQPDDRNYNYPFAWGDHVDRRRERQRQQRQSRI